MSSGHSYCHPKAVKPPTVLPRFKGLVWLLRVPDYFALWSIFDVPGQTLSPKIWLLLKKKKKKGSYSQEKSKQETHVYHIPLHHFPDLYFKSKTKQHIWCKRHLPLYNWKHATSQTKPLKSLSSIQTPALRSMNNIYSFVFHSIASLFWYFANHKMITKSDNTNTYKNLVERDFKKRKLKPLHDTIRKETE